MIILFLLIMLYLISVLVYGLYALWHIDEGWYVPYKETELDKKIRNIKSRYALCFSQLS